MTSTKKYFKKNIVCYGQKKSEYQRQENDIIRYIHAIQVVQVESLNFFWFQDFFND